MSMPNCISTSMYLDLIISLNCLLCVFVISGVQLNQSCLFDEQCEYVVWNSMCKNYKCICRGDGKPEKLEDGSIKCKGILGYVFINLLNRSP